MWPHGMGHQKPLTKHCLHIVLIGWDVQLERWLKFCDHSSSHNLLLYVHHNAAIKHDVQVCNIAAVEL